MMTTVKVLIEGNKACEVYVSNGPNEQPDAPTVVKPGGWVTMTLIHGEKKVVVQETGDFLK